MTPMVPETMKCFLLTGKDGIDLIRRITTLDPSLVPENFVRGFILSPMGKIRAEIFIRMINPESAECLARSVFFKILNDFTFAENYTLSESQTPNSITTCIADDLDHRIKNLIPAFGFEFLEDELTNPLDLGLIETLHDQKGCYPGQEVIEKMIAIGDAPKRLCRLEKISGISSTLDQLHFPFGKITSLSRDGRHALAILRKTHAEMNSHITLEDGSQWKIVAVKNSKRES